VEKQENAELATGALSHLSVELARAMEEIPIWMRKPIKVEKPDSLITKYWKGQQSAEATKKKASGAPSLDKNPVITNDKNPVITNEKRAISGWVLVAVEAEVRLTVKQHTAFSISWLTFFDSNR
jgi:hypothetical protein